MWHCDICDKIFYEEFKDNHLKSRFHKRLANSIIRKYIINNPKPDKIDDIIEIYLRLHYKNYEKFLAIISVKLLIPSNQIKYIRRRQECRPRNGCVLDSSFFSKIKIFKEQLFSQILDLRIIFVSRFENMIFDHYLTKPKSMLERKIISILDKNREIVCLFDYDNHCCKHPLFQEFFDIYIDEYY